MIRKLTVTCLALISTLSLTLGASASSESILNNGSVIWPEKQALPTFAKPKQLDAADIYDAPGDIKLLLATLQGIVNRAEPRIYLLENQEEGKLTWLNDLKVPYNLYEDYWDIVKKYKKEVKGIIVYDPKVADSVNVATTLAGLEDAVVASPALAAQLKASPFNLKVLEDLQGKFKDRLDAYTWQYENLWKKTTNRMLIGLSPDTSIKMPPGLPESFKTIAEELTQERDGNNKKTYELDLSGFLGKESVYLRFDDAFPQDGWGPAVHEVTVKADGQTIAQFIPGTPEEEAFLYDRQSSQVSSGQGGHRFADNGRYFVYKFTPPAGTKQLTASVFMWNQYKVSAGNIQPLSSEQKEPYGYLRDYAVANKAMVFWLDSNVPEQKALFEKILSDVKPGTPYLGWFSNDVEGEFSSVEITSNHSVYVLAADWFSNLTVFSGTKAKPVEAKTPEAPKLENKIYVTYTFSEGDNFQYNQHRMRILWDDPARGKVPINWTSSPLLYDGAPAMLNYYQETATENDLIIAGPSGAGYFYPEAWPDATFSDFLKQSYKYLKKTGMTIPYVLNRVNSENVPLSESKAAAYENDYKASGLFLSWENHHGVEIVNGSLPLSTIQGISTAQDGKNVLDEVKANWDGKSPLFVSLGLLAWSMTPSDVVAVTESLGPEYQAVRADHYFSLIREAHGLPAKPQVQAENEDEE
ncbi:GxGYxYP domain-containing protein [Paenibacillus prosopidis]|uniref:GxGYxY motif-containing protein n=1 Tax=Paenibacillus prosopidis TaxID=630520 RepID=A0A368W0V8_9BACL|nr:GxGYxYP domain-containing protein [Paenibacillus prosopidis]RCW47978.1 GxGYxY motif-containing protein [Paenibacillus prosopidis]